MAILVALFGKIRQIFSSYVQATDGSSSASPFVLEGNPYSMPLIYIIILACIAVIGYFFWLSYRQEVQEERLQEKSATKEEGHSNYNLTWINKVINWAHMSSSPGESQAIKRWIEDINITLAKTQSPLKILLFGIRDGSIPPWLREVGQPKKVENHIEIPVLLEATDFGFIVSVQEEDRGRVNASTYNAVVQQFRCWCTVILSRIEGQVLAKIVISSEKANVIKFAMKSMSDQRIASTVPEVVADIIKSGVLSTPFYLNISTWGSVIPTSQMTPVAKNTHKDTNGNTVTSTSVRRRLHKSKTLDSDDVPVVDQVIGTPPSGLTSESNRAHGQRLDRTPGKAMGDQLQTAKQAHGLSGSLGSLVGIKRTPSGRGSGPPKPIRAREKQLVINVVKSKGLISEASLYCKASLDNPSQKCKTRLAQSGSDRSWPDDKLQFDLSSRSSEVKLVVCERRVSSKRLEDEVIASGILCLDGIDIARPSEHELQLKTLNKNPAQLTLQLTFTENLVDVNSMKPRPNPSPAYSPRRSLDLSLIANQLPPMVQEKGDGRSRSTSSTLSSFSNENASMKGSQGVDSSPSTTVTTTTTRKVSPNRTAPRSNLPPSQSAPNMQGDTEPSSISDTSFVNGSVAEIAMNDLSKQAKIADKSVEQKTRLKKGRVVITAVGKAAAGDATADQESLPITNGASLEEQVVPNKLERLPGEEMYYSMCSLSTPSGSEAPTEQPVKDAAAPKAPQVEETKVDTQGANSTRPKKQRRKRDKRPKSMVAGVRHEDMPQPDDQKEWPKVRRSRSLVFGKGRKKQYKTGSAADLDKHENNKEEVYPEGYDEDCPVTVPENELQKHNKKKKSKSISKLFSMLGRKPSMRKTKKDTDIAEDALEPSTNEHYDDHLRVPDPSVHSSSFASNLPSQEDDESMRRSPPGSDRPSHSAVGSETESFVSEMTDTGLSPSLSQNSSLLEEKSSVKRSKSLRKRLFGGKRKTIKN